MNLIRQQFRYWLSNLLCLSQDAAAEDQVNEMLNI